ncbi:XdhC family protein [Aestuariibius sp. 2305UL40-4]|uniref:XdhC family protein n=1 Tax=Aestuariibius violaceus TaxID=3234132 RepID=UPI00345E324E
MTETETLLQTALDWHRAGRGVAVASVVETWGSAPRPAGSLLVIADDGGMAGSVSGGCVEGAVVVEALEALEDGGARMLDYGVSDDEAFAVGLACGGRIRVRVEPVGSVLPVGALEEMADRAARREPFVRSVALAGGGAEILGMGEGADAVLRRGKSGLSEDGARFDLVHAPPLRLGIIGAVHIAQALVPMARLAGYAPAVVDPRPAFASEERFPETELLDDWPDAALEAYGIDGRTAVVTLTHDPKLDDPGLQAALRSDAFYIGALGSTRTHAKRVARLQAAGFTNAQIGRIHAPVGLDIGAATPGEIAVAVLAEMTQALRRG